VSSEIGNSNRWLNKWLPQVDDGDVHKESTFACTEIFEELDKAIDYSRKFRHMLKDQQRGLLDRVFLVLRDAAHDILLAEGFPTEIAQRTRLDVSVVERLAAHEDVHTSCDRKSTHDYGVGLEVVESIEGELQRLRDKVHYELRNEDGGKISVLESIMLDDDPSRSVNELDRIYLRRLVRELQVLSSEIAVCFRVRAVSINELKNDLLREVDLKHGSDEVFQRQLTVEDFMSKHKPSGDKPIYVRTTDDLIPYLKDISILRDRGFSWKDICLFLKGNGVQPHLSEPSIVAGFLKRSRAKQIGNLG